MTDASSSNAAFYCPVHQIRFHTAAIESIQCERNAHALGAGFPYQSWWTYCCDCATFSPYEPVNGNNGLRECFVCERQFTKRYLCNKCRVISLESDAVVRRKLYSIDATTVRPNCPGCGLLVTGGSIEHECAEVKAGFLTAASACAFCDLELAGSQRQSDRSNENVCGGCGTEMLANFRFCKRCGKPRLQTPPVIEIVNVRAPESLAISTSDPHVTDEEFADYDDDEFQSELDEIDSTADLTDADVAPRPWAGPQLEATRKHRNPWVIGAVVALLAMGVFVIIASIGGNRAPTPAPKPSPPSLPTHAGMVYVDGGEFTMGSDTGDEYERPAHRVKVAPFYMDVNEITCDDYLKFIKAKGHRMPAGWSNGSYPPGTARQPVTGVDWDDANAYAEWVGKRLPTEEEWEFAARGAGGNRYSWGNEWRADAANAGEASRQRLTDVGSYPQGKTPSGILDLIGNAWEWTASDVVAYPGGHFSEPVWDDAKVIRGGSWHQSKEQATTTYRGFLRKSAAKDYSATGFRCAQDFHP